MNYTQDQAARAAASHHAAQLALASARTCACGEPAGIILYHATAGIVATLPACGPCAWTLMDLGWTPERSEVSR